MLPERDDAEQPTPRLRQGDQADLGLPPVRHRPPAPEFAEQGTGGDVRGPVLVGDDAPESDQGRQGVGTPAVPRRRAAAGQDGGTGEGGGAVGGGEGKGCVVEAQGVEVVGVAAGAFASDGDLEEDGGGGGPQHRLGRLAAGRSQLRRVGKAGGAPEQDAAAKEGQGMAEQVAGGGEFGQGGAIVALRQRAHGFVLAGQGQGAGQPQHGERGLGTAPGAGRRRARAPERAGGECQQQQAGQEPAQRRPHSHSMVAGGLLEMS